MRLRAIQGYWLCFVVVMTIATVAGSRSTAAQDSPAGNVPSTPPRALPGTKTAATGESASSSDQPESFPGDSSSSGFRSVPSLESSAAPTNAPRTRSSPPSNLPNQQGQVWAEYDLRPYTSRLKDVDKPHQAVVDWVLRETGTDVWFTEPFGFMNADRDTLRVYHTKEMQEVVKSVVDKFTQGMSDKQVIGIRLITISSPNWRTRAMSLMKSVKVQAPGVNAWLVTKENSALLLAMLRGRGDVRELQAADIVIHNGQSQQLEQVRSRNYVGDIQRVDGAWPPFLPQTSEIQEGYRLLISPLVSPDRQAVDVVLKASIDQVEKLVDVNLEMPLGGNQVSIGQINVPQVSSWRLHERFRWPADQVLVLSCGVVAAPAGPANSTLLGQSGGLRSLLPGAPAERADALMILQYKGDGTNFVPSAPAPQQQQALQPTISRGRY